MGAFDLGAMMGGGMDKFSAFVKNNPEQLWMMLDGAGQMFDPNNSAAGIGTQVAQASLMEQEQKAIDAAAKPKKEWHSELGDLLGGMPQTEQGVKGLTSHATKVNADGTTTFTATGNSRNLGDSQTSTWRGDTQSPQSLGQDINGPIGGYDLGRRDPK